MGLAQTVLLKWTPIFEWCVVICGRENRYQNDTCFKEIKLRVQNLLIFLGSRVLTKFEESILTIIQ